MRSQCFIDACLSDGWSLRVRDGRRAVGIGLRGYGRAFSGAEPVEIFELHQHPRIFCQGVCMPPQKIPIQRGERTGLGAGGLRRVEWAGLAIVAHPIDVFPTGDIGFAGHDAAVGELPHAHGVGQFNPLDGIHINGQIPLVNLPRLDS